MLESLSSQTCQHVLSTLHGPVFDDVVLPDQVLTPQKKVLTSFVVLKALKK